MFKEVGLTLLTALMTKDFLKDLVIYLLKTIAAETDNTVDDEIVKMVVEALEPVQV